MSNLLRRPWLLAAAALAAVSLVLVLAVVVRLARHGSWATGARVVRWIGPDGRTIASKDAPVPCSRDVLLRTLRHADRVWWTVCDPVPGAAENGSFAAVDFSRGVGRLDWPFPAALPFDRTVALAPRPDGALGVVYRSTAGAKPAAAVAGPEGWLVGPEALDDGSRSAVVGATWTGDAFEVVLRFDVTTDDPAPALRIHTLPPGKPLSSREVARATAIGGLVNASIEAAYRRTGEERWRFLVEGERVPGEAVALWDVPEGAVPERTEISGAQVWGDYADFTAAGLLADSAQVLRKALQPDGSFDDVPGAPAALSGAARWGGHYVTRSDRLELAEVWFVSDAQGRGFAWNFDGRLVMPRVDATGDGEFVVLSDVSDPGADRARVVARADALATNLGYSGAIEPLANDGFRLFSTDARYVSADRELERSDPLGIGEHLRRRGSRIAGGGESRHAWYLVWIFAGLPIAIGAAVPFGRMRAKRRYEPFLEAVEKPALIAVGAYLVSAAVLIAMLWPLMR